jgi:hypothetical protein
MTIFMGTQCRCIPQETHVFKCILYLIEFELGQIVNITCVDNLIVQRLVNSSRIFI